MIKIECHFRSKSLYTPVSIIVLLPSFFEHAATVETLDEVYRKREKYRTLFLLHGGFEDSHSWLRNTRIEAYADRHKLAVVLPNVANSCYANQVHGMPYWDFVSDELPRFVRSVFPLSEKREDNYVAGLSMGGYGAFKMALNKPEMFAAGISLSGALDMAGLLQKPIVPQFGIQHTFGSFENLVGSNNDLFAQLERITGEGRDVPRLYMACGTEDNLIGANHKFLDFARSRSVDVCYEEGPGGHEWTFWDAYLNRGLNWLDNCQSS